MTIAFDVMEYEGLDPLDGNSDEFFDLYGYNLDEETSTIPEADLYPEWDIGGWE